MSADAAIPAAKINSDLPSISSQSQDSEPSSRFSGLRGIEWRINLGILPSFDSSIDDLRRVTANSRRRYANLKRRIIVDPHFSKYGNESADHVMDNPLSQNPDSTWGRFFQNVELERLLDQDLSRLYPEEGSYFQTATSQSMLRRILLFWCLLHPDLGYRQGMHELLAPLLYVLHLDVQYLLQVRGKYIDHFNDDFNGASIPDSDFLSKYRFRESRNSSIKRSSDISLPETAVRLSSLDELDPETRDLFLISDVYGAEGELGVIVSEKFMEHDAYSMFDNLMNGGNGVVAITELFSPTPSPRAVIGMSAITEASSAICHLLSVVDSSLHSHLIEIGVETQYFAIRWLRLLFGREFSLDNLFLLWDEIFSTSNHSCFPESTNDTELNCRILSSPRGAFISAMAVSMLVYLRYSLLGTEHATSCLQKLLNFPGDVNIKNLIMKAKSLQAVALDSGLAMCSHVQKSKNKRSLRREQSLSFDSSTMALNPMTDSYWEERWKVLHAAEESSRNHENEISRTPIKTPLRHAASLATAELTKLVNGKSHESDHEVSNIATSVFPPSNIVPKVYSAGQGDQYIFRRSLSLAEKRVLAPKDSIAATASRAISNKNNDVKSTRSGKGTPDVGKQATDKKPPSGKFHWFRKFSRSTSEKISQKARDVKQTESSTSGNLQTDTSSATTLGGDCNISGECKNKLADENNVSDTLRSYGKSMLHNIQVIESILKQDEDALSSVDNTSRASGKQQVALLGAIRELKTISNLLSEM